jgi:hypothetical protein
MSQSIDDFYMWLSLLITSVIGLATFIWFLFFKMVNKVYPPIDINCQSKELEVMFNLIVLLSFSNLLFVLNYFHSNQNHVRKSVLYPFKDKDDFLKTVFDNVQTLSDVLSRGLRMSSKFDVYLS